MYDWYNRSIDYLRISLTDQCNLRCTYCMPAKGRTFLKPDILLTDEQIIECIAVTSGLGISKIRLTGGEPLLRKGIIDLVKRISDIKGINDLAITTNGILLKHYARDLAKAGLKRVNVSLDTVDPEKYRDITRGGNLYEVLEGIKAARLHKLNPVKINCVVENSKDEINAIGVGIFGKKNKIDVRYIRKMDLQKGEFHQVEGGAGGNCDSCNRMRLTADGFFKPCLFDSHKYSIREFGIEEAFMLALHNKPIKGTFDKVNEFYYIGG